MFKSAIKYLMLAAALVLAPSVASAAASYPFIKPSVAAVEAMGAACGTTVSGVWIPNVGHYAWNGSSTATADGVNILQCTGVATGRMIIDPGPLALASITAMQNLPGPVNDTAVLIGGSQGGWFTFYTASTCATNTGTCFPANDATAGKWERAFTGTTYETSWFGVLCNGSTDDYAVEQAAINAVPDYGTVHWSASSTNCNTSATLTVSHPLTIDDEAPIAWTTSNIAGFSVTSSNVTFKHYNLIGIQDSVIHTNEAAIFASGTFNAGLAPTNITNIHIGQGTVTNWGGFGIELAYVNGFTISKPYISGVGYAGLALVSALNGTITDSYIHNICPGQPAATECYGFFASRASSDTGELTSQPRTSNVTINGGICDGVPTWECYDTHAGDHITFNGVIARNAYDGMMIGTSPDHTGAYVYGPHDVTVNGGVLDSGKTDGSANYGLVFQGASADPATGSVNGIDILDYGDSTNGVEGTAVLLQDTLGLTFRATIRYPSPIGILLYGGNIGLSITGTSCVDPWTNTVAVGEVECIYGRSTGNDVTISGNSFLHYNKSATYLLTTASGVGMRFAADATSNIWVGSNRSNATQYFENDGVNSNLGRATANGATDVTVANTLVDSWSNISITPYTASSGIICTATGLTPGTSFTFACSGAYAGTVNYRIEH